MMVDIIDQIFPFFLTVLSGPVKLFMHRSQILPTTGQIAIYHDCVYSLDLIQAPAIKQAPFFVSFYVYQVISYS